MSLEFEVLRTGAFTDSKGVPLVVDEQGLQQIADSYNPEEHEAPIVVGHPDCLPQNGEPAYGWIEGLYRKGDRLIAKAKQIIPEMLDLITAGHYKKVSIGLTPEKTLHHVGLLGGQPPAVKGLAPITFAEGEMGFSTITGEIAVTDDESEPQANEQGSSEAATVTGTGQLEVTVKELQEKLNKIEEQIHVLTTNPPKTENTQLTQEVTAFHAFVDEALGKGRLTPVHARMFKEMTAGLKTNDIQAFAEQPGEMFAIARKLVLASERPILQAMQYTPQRTEDTSGGGYNAAREIIAKQMK